MYLFSHVAPRSVVAVTGRSSQPEPAVAHGVNKDTEKPQTVSTVTTNSIIIYLLCGVI